MPTIHPTVDPTTYPTSNPSINPTIQPTLNPSEPTYEINIFAEIDSNNESNITVRNIITIVNDYIDSQNLSDCLLFNNFTTNARTVNFTIIVCDSAAQEKIGNVIDTLINATFSLRRKYPTQSPTTDPTQTPTNRPTHPTSAPSLPHSGSVDTGSNQTARGSNSDNNAEKASGLFGTDELIWNILICVGIVLVTCCIIFCCLLGFKYVISRDKEKAQMKKNQQNMTTSRSTELSKIQSVSSTDNLSSLGMTKGYIFNPSSPMKSRSLQSNYSNSHPNNVSSHSNVTDIISSQPGSPISMPQNGYNPYNNNGKTYSNPFEVILEHANSEIASTQNQIPMQNQSQDQGGYGRNMFHLSLEDQSSYNIQNDHFNIDTGGQGMDGETDEEDEDADDTGCDDMISVTLE